MSDFNSADFAKKINNLLIAINFSGSREKNLDEVIDEFLQKNINLGLERTKVFEFIKNIQNLYENDSQLFPQGEAIKNWNKNQILTWGREIKDHQLSKNNIPEVIGVIKRANFLHSGHEARSTQILSLFSMITEDKGKLLQISTGEGKSTITSMFAALKAIQGEYVDVMTSSKILAQRDLKEKQEFYEILGISANHNIGNSSGEKGCYKSDVVYGDISSFQYDYLNHIYNKNNMRGTRAFNIALVDEVDSMLINESSKIAKLSGPIPGMEYLEPILIGISNELNRINKHFIVTEEVFNSKLCYVDAEFEYKDGNIKFLNQGSDEDIYLVDNKTEFITKNLESYAEKIINDDSVVIPQNLRDFALKQVKNWALSAFNALHMTENRNYLILDDNGNKVISPIDYSNTGAVQKSTHWDQGLHQFLQIKHSLKIRPENLTTNFISNISYLKNYGNNIYGMTGTLGSNDAQKLLSDIYNVNIGFIPTYKKKQFIELPGVICENNKNWIDTIIYRINQEISFGKGVLAICETISDVKAVENALKVTYPANKIRVYSRDDNSEALAITTHIDSGEVIIATNLAWRGTDIKTTSKVENNGGLYVCVTYLPGNLRVEEQAFGRTARQGKKGTAQLIIDKPRTESNLSVSYPAIKNAYSIEDFKHWRNLGESERLKEAKFKQYYNITTKDALFKEFCDDIYHKLFYEETKSPNQLQAEEYWGMFLKDIEYRDFIVSKNYDGINAIKNIAYNYDLSVVEMPEAIDSIYHAILHQLSNKQYSVNTLKKNSSFSC